MAVSTVEKKSGGQAWLAYLLLVVVLLATGATSFLVWQELDPADAPKRESANRDSEVAEPVKELPPPPAFEEWIVGSWQLAQMNGAIAEGAAKGSDRITIAIEPDSADPSLFIATVTDCGGESNRVLRLKPQKDEPLLRFRFLSESSERGGSARFRVSKWSTTKVPAGWTTRNDYAYVDYRGQKIHGTVGTWLKE